MGPEPERYTLVQRIGRRLGFTRHVRELKVQNQLLTERLTFTATEVNRRDDHIRALTESLSTQVQERDAKISELSTQVQERDAKISELTKRTADLEKYSDVSLVA